MTTPLFPDFDPGEIPLTPRFDPAGMPEGLGVAECLVIGAFAADSLGLSEHLINWWDRARDDAGWLEGLLHSPTAIEDLINHLRGDATTEGARKRWALLVGERFARSCEAWRRVATAPPEAVGDDLVDAAAEEQGLLERTARTAAEVVGGPLAEMVAVLSDPWFLDVWEEEGVDDEDRSRWADAQIRNDLVALGLLIGGGSAPEHLREDSACWRYVQGSRDIERLLGERLGERAHPQLGFRDLVDAWRDRDPQDHARLRLASAVHHVRRVRNEIVHTARVPTADELERLAALVEEVSRFGS